MMPLLLCVVAAALLAVTAAGGAMFLLVKTGRLPLGASAGESKPKPAAEVPTHAVAMEPMLANLADEDGHSYLRLGVVLQVQDSAKKKEAEKDAKAPNAENALLRDHVLEVLGRQRSSELLAPNGKEELKKMLKAKFAEAGGEAKVTEIFFTDFLVQR